MSKSEASIHRPLALRLRPDLQATCVQSARVTTWVVKDPLTLEHFQFSAEEYALMAWLRQPVSIAELQRLFGRTFPPQTITPQAVWDFLGRLHDAGLVMSAGSAQGEELLGRMRRERTRRWALSWTGLLAMRFRGVDPDRFLTAVHERCRWLFSPLALVPVILVILFALRLVIGHFDEFTQRLPEMSALFDARNLPWLLFAIGMVKALHELGHALACKHFGGEVRELGFMLLVFAPCLYCDVSDAWRLPSKWRRIAVSAAGIIVEIVLAAVATIVWWYAQPGVVQLVALNVMIICSVNTLLVNGNPLLRYDGYYVLSDLVEVPNLWIRSREALRRYATNWLFASRGVPAPDDPLVPARQRPWLAMYAIASKTYLLLVFVGIVWGLVKYLHPYHLENLAYLVGLIVLGSALVAPITSASKFARNPIRRAELRKGRFALVAAIGLAAIVGVLALPVNYHVKAPVVLMPADAARVSATIDGTLANTLPAGRHVKRGETIGQLTNSKTQLELEKLEGELRLRQLRVEHLERLRGLDREANDDLPTAQAALADSARRLEELRHDAQRLSLVTPSDGVIIPAPRLPSPNPSPNWGGARGGARLATWSGSLLDESNGGAHVEPGTLVCLVGDPMRLTAVMLVDDTDVKRLQPGQKARLRLDQLPGQVIEGEVVDVARHDVQSAANDAASRADLESLYAGAVSPEHTGAIYQARVQFKTRPESLVIGGRGQAKVAAERITIARLILRYFAQTFRLPV
ncbi:MAG: HlyD family efflux transporter periplasmic adaptor subunit [Planctomycetes bacterium]|nr:HlyD family efflux transporter periplasmic adaptor subunit [Planctomycetota bacterium]